MPSNTVILLLPSNQGEKVIVTFQFRQCENQSPKAEAFHKFFSSSRLFQEIPQQRSRSYYWDVELYANKALNPNCDAFYPLWPSIIRTFFHPQTIDQAAHYFLIVATALFFISTFLVLFNINLFDFHPEVIAVPSLLAAVLAARRGKIWWFCLTILLVFGCKAVLSLTVTVMGVWLLVFERVFEKSVGL
ncbi:MAG: DUF2079 domain-containing protein [Stigonema ocellatum SAG 48.90 = DSM 106950]|nr:DUF2079 domain-containing protein [Stigonema ocellatum SAG 48.90 = DSM 106950]